jgi:hypothetical protein
VLAALPVIERREGAANPFHTVVALVAIAASLWIASHADATAWAMFGTLVAAGTALYFIARRRAQGLPDSA